MTPALPHHPHDGSDRLEELLLAEATQGLSPAEATELDALLAAAPDVDPDALGRAAAAVHLALAPPPEALPAALADRLRRAAPAIPPPTPAPAPTPAPVRPRALAWSGWVVAAGLGGVLIYTNWPEPPLAQKRARLESDPAARAATFVGAKNGASGTIVWSDTKQEGYMEVRGLPPVDAAAGTYQLWIVDGGRKGSQPVDGGVFKVNPDGTALVPVRVPIQVKNAIVFAITKETEPLGVVVSTKEHLVELTPKTG